MYYDLVQNAIFIFLLYNIELLNNVVVIICILNFNIFLKMVLTH